MEVACEESEDKSEQSNVTSSQQQQPETTNDDDAFMSCQVNISITKTLTEESKLYKATVNKEYVTCGPLNHRTSSSSSERLNDKTSATSPGAKPPATHMNKENSTELVSDVFHTAEAEDSMDSPSNEFCIIDAVSLKDRQGESSRNGDHHNNEFSITDVVSLKDGDNKGTKENSRIDIIDDDINNDADYEEADSQPSSLFSKVSAVTPSSFVLDDQSITASDSLRIKHMLLDMTKLRNKPTTQTQRKQNLDALFGMGQNKPSTQTQRKQNLDALLGTGEGEDDLMDTHFMTTATSDIETIRQNCSKCNRTFLDISNFERHEQYCGKHICHQCNRVFLKRPYLLKHKNRGNCTPLAEIKVEPGIQQYTEDIENEYEMYDGSEMEEVTPVVKPSFEEVRMFGSPHPKPFHCHLCGRGFSKKLSLQTHLQNHDSYRHKCDICNQLFAKGAYVLSHKKLVHGVVVKSQNGPHHLTHSNHHPSPSSTPSSCGKPEKFTCNQCNRTYSHEENFREHVKLHAVPKRFVCNRCGRRFAKNGALQTHLRNHDEFTHSCSICRQVFARTRDLNAHMALDHDILRGVRATNALEAAGDEPVSNIESQTPYSCTVCNKQFVKEGNLRIHEKLCLTGERKFVCDKCGRSFSQQKYLRAHLRNHDQYQFSCSICQQMFGTVQYLGRHMKIEHSDHNTDNSTPCKESTKNNTGSGTEEPDEPIEALEDVGVDNHLDSVEESNIIHDKDESSPSTKSDIVVVDEDGKTRHCCKFCDRQYSTKWNLSVHERLHVPQGKPFKCNRCGRRFNEKSSLDMHLLRHDSYKYKCKICLQVFGKPNFLQRHEETAHGNRKRPTSASLMKSLASVEAKNNKSSDTIELPTPNKSGRFVCSQCNRSYSSAHSLKAHEVLHSLPQPHSCELCGRKFVKSDSLRKHLLYHDIYTDICEVCGQVFGSAAFLRKHKQQEHKDETSIANEDDNSTIVTNGTASPKLSNGDASGHSSSGGPLVCPKCNKTFQRRGNMVIHMKMCSPDRFECERCGRKFKKLSILQAHLQNHDAMKHQCPTCNQMFFRGDFLHIHMQEEHGIVANPKDLITSHVDDIPQPTSFHNSNGAGEASSSHQAEYVCNKCKKTFRRLSNLNIHMKLCSTDRLKCKKCGRRFKKLSVLQSHEQNHDAMRHRCPVCNQMFFRNTILELHMVEDHKMDINEVPKQQQTMNAPVQESFSCDKCNKVFTRMGNLKFHRKICAPDKYDCHKCGRRFKESKVLANHLRNHDQMRHKCELCPQVFFRPTFLRMHMKEDHRSALVQSGAIKSQQSSGTLTSQVGDSNAASTSLPYKCSKCPRSYATHDSYRNHLRWHESDKIHKCQTCGKCFQHRTSLTKHLINHRRYQHHCDICNQPFPRDSFLQRHRETEHAEILSPNPPPKPTADSTNSQDSIKIEPVDYELETHVVSPKKQETHVVSPKKQETHVVSPKKQVAEQSTGASGSLPCYYCPETFLSNSERQEHQDSCENREKCLCYKCGRVYTHVGMLDKHLKNHHEYKHYCDICNQVFTRVFHVEKHKKTRHPNAPPSNSKVAATIPKSAQTQDDQIVTVAAAAPVVSDETKSEVNVPTETCLENTISIDDEFTSLFSIKRQKALSRKQLRRAHFTKKFFRLRSRLLPFGTVKIGPLRVGTSRAGTFRGSPPSAPPLPTTVPKSENPNNVVTTTKSGRKVYPCTRCDKVFRHRMSLRRHLKKHHCDQCEEVFENSRELIHHKTKSHGTAATYTNGDDEVTDEQVNLAESDGEGDDTEGETTEGETTEGETTEGESEKEETTEDESVEQKIKKEFDELNMETQGESSEEGPTVIAPEALQVVNAGDAPRYSCPTCQTTFGHKKNLRTHQKTAVKTQCCFCPRFFCHARPLLIHEKKCEREKNAGKSHVKARVQSKSEPPTTTDGSSTHEDSVDNLDEDLETSEFTAITSPQPHKYVRNQNYNCDGCDKVFLSYRDMAAHRLIHSGKTALQCDWCEKTFTRKDSLEVKHQKVAQKLQCDVCGMRFCLPHRFKFHMKKHELDQLNSLQLNEVRPYTAPKEISNNISCDGGEGDLDLYDEDEVIVVKEAEAVDSIDLQDSINDHLNLNLNKQQQSSGSRVESGGDTADTPLSESAASLGDESVSPVNTPTERDYMECRVLVPSTKSFTETLVKWKCPECDVMCGKRTSLINHLKTHSNVKPFKCTWCSWSFRRKDSLTGHLKLGNQQKCAICGDQFCREKYFIMHMRKHEHDHEFEDPALFATLEGADDMIPEEEEEEEEEVESQGEETAGDEEDEEEEVWSHNISC